MKTLWKTVCEMFYLAAAVAAAVVVAGSAFHAAGQCPGGQCPGGQSFGEQYFAGQRAGGGQCVGGQCPGGQCTGRRQASPFPNNRAPSDSAIPNAERRSKSAWRYADAVGYHAAAVRIYSMESDRARSMGSGVLVTWGGRLLILTARHVVVDAKQIIIEFWTREAYYARTLNVDAEWDCAVLELVESPRPATAGNADRRATLPKSGGSSTAWPEPARLELGNAAMLEQGDRLESCGYGPDGRLAVNSGEFLGYRRSSARSHTPPDDWLELSGRARQGDSGGPIFNARGKVVGILWGTNGEVVVGVQAGRLHRLLNDAFSTNHAARRASNVLRRAATVSSTAPCGDFIVCTTGSVAADARPDVTTSTYYKTGYDRQPTPPVATEPAIPFDTLPEADPRDIPLPHSVETGKADAGRKAVLPWRNETENRDDRQDARIDALIRWSEEQSRESAERARQSRPSDDASANVGRQDNVESEPTDDEPSPLIAGACVFAAIVAGFVLYFSFPQK